MSSRCSLLHTQSMSRHNTRSDRKEARCGNAPSVTACVSLSTELGLLSKSGEKLENIKSAHHNMNRFFIEKTKLFSIIKTKNMLIKTLLYHSLGENNIVVKLVGSVFSFITSCRVRLFQS